MTNIPGDDAFKYKPPGDAALETDPKAIPVPTGYRKMSPEEFALFEAITYHAELTRQLVDRVLALPINEIGYVTAQERPRWTAIARTQLQQGYMALKRAVALPNTF